MKLRNSLLAGVVLALCAAPSSAGPQPPTGWTDGYVIANGIRIHYWRTGGNKPALVMAHGSSDDGLCWTNLAREFQDQYDIVMFDARGHGLSDPPSPSDPPDVQVEDLAGLIKELKLVRPILMGHSMGSSSVARFAAKYPDVARAVILRGAEVGAVARIAALGTDAEVLRLVADPVVGGRAEVGTILDVGAVGARERAFGLVTYAVVHRRTLATVECIGTLEARVAAFGLVAHAVVLREADAGAILRVAAHRAQAGAARLVAHPVVA